MKDSKIRLTLDGGKLIEFAGPADITVETTDAIVNAANSSLLGGGGVDGAIHDAGGPAILAECRQIVGKIGSLPAGKALITTGGRLAAKYVIHTVGPTYRNGREGEPEQLASCHTESIRLAEENNLQSLSFPAISTGAFGYPLSEAADIAVSATVASLRQTKGLSKVRFVLFSTSALNAYLSAAEKFAKVNPESTCKFEKGNS